MFKQFAIGLAAAGAVLAAGMPGANAAFPEKDITFIIPYGPGGGFDSYVRKVAPLMEKHLPGGVNVVPKNEPGAGGRKAVASVYRAKPDGYTIAIFNMPGMALDQIVGKKTRFDIKKFSWIAQLAVSPYVMGVAKNGPFNSVEDLQKADRQLKYGETSASSTAGISGRIVAATLGINTKYISGYKGSAKIAITLIQGNTDYHMFAERSFTKYAESGDLKPILSFREKSAFPGVPTPKDIGHPELLDLGVNRFVGAPPDTPSDVVKVLEEAILKSLDEKEMQEWVRPVAGLNAEETTKKVERLITFFTKYKSALQ